MEDRAYLGDFSTKAQAAKQVPSIAVHLDRCMTGITELAAQRDRISMIADKVKGPTPVNAESGKGHLQSQACLVGSTEFIARRLDELVADISEQLHLIETALG